MSKEETIKSIFAVIVVYKEHIENSISYKSLVDSLKPNEIETLDLLIYDNSPEYHYIPSSIILPHTYIHNPLNPGLSEAYNAALRLACERNKKWLFLLDDDTILNQEFLIATFHYAAELQAQNEISAIVPEIQTKDFKVVSPHKMTFNGLFIPFPLKKPHILHGRVSALNSGSLISVEFLNSIKGFPEDYPLDMLDHWVFRQIFMHKKKIFGHNKYILHDLSVYSKEYMDKVRYFKKYLPAERKFFSTENRIVFFFYKINLVIRAIEQLIIGKKEFAILSWKAFINRL